MPVAEEEEKEEDVYVEEEDDVEDAAWSGLARRSGCGGRRLVRPGQVFRTSIKLSLNIALPLLFR